VPAQLGEATLVARTAAQLSQTALASRLKTSQANILKLEKDDRSAVWGGNIAEPSTLPVLRHQPAHCLSPSIPSTPSSVRSGEKRVDVGN